jgi:hypothetical protein
VITTVSAVLNLWDLVSFFEDVRAREQEIRAAIVRQQQGAGENRLARGDRSHARSQLATARRMIVAQTNLAQQETVLKNA